MCNHAEDGSALLRLGFGGHPASLVAQNGILRSAKREAGWWRRRRQQAAPALDLKSEVSLSPGYSARTYRDRTARGDSPFGDAPRFGAASARIANWKRIVQNTRHVR